MTAQELVLIDTCIWVPYFNRPRSAEKQAVDRLLDDDCAALVGPILTEILLGFRRDEHADWVASLLRGLHFLTVTWDEWRSAARLGRQLTAKGHSLPLSDLVVASVAMTRGHAVYSSVPHFDLIPGLVRYKV